MPALLRALRRLGADIHSTKPDESPPFVVFGGGLNGGKVRLSEPEARYLPAVFLPAPHAKKKVEFSLPSSKKFQLESTLELMKTARAKITERKGVVSIPNHPYHAFNYRVRREVVGAAPFIMAAGLLNSRLKLRGVKEISFRDAAFLQALKSFGLKLYSSGKSIEVEESHRLRGTQLNLSWAPELLPLMTVLACGVRGKTLIRNAGEARAMKSDRISTSRRSYAGCRREFWSRATGWSSKGQLNSKVARWTAMMITQLPLLWPWLASLRKEKP
jgi:3-phosphoshikimate 1-carboxyvinyltransferase